MSYRVRVIRMKDRDVDRTIRKLERKQKRERLDRSDLLEVLLTPLMSGEMPQQERISRGIRLLKGEREHVEREELARMEAVLYTFAMKFLDDQQLKEVKEEMDMTILGEMILKDGIEKGMKKGIETGIEKGEEHIIRLNQTLINENRYDDLKRATEDRAFRKKLMKELFPEELAHMEAVLYTIAMKFLDDQQLKEVKEEMDMTILGEMILKDGIEKGIETGIEKGEEHIIRLNQTLINENRYDDLKRATEDRAFRKKLMKELFPEEL